MSQEEDAVIIGGGKKKNAVEVSVKPQGVATPADVLKQYTTWVLMFILAGPELYQAAVALGLADAGGAGGLTTVLRALAAAGLALKFIRQTKPADPAE